MVEGVDWQRTQSSTPLMQVADLTLQRGEKLVVRYAAIVDVNVFRDRESVRTLTWTETRGRSSIMLRIGRSVLDPGPS